MKYVLLVSFFIILATILPTFMRYQANVTANVVGYAKETRTSTYKVNFHNNGGTGTMESMTMHYNEAKKIAKNTFTREGYNFIGWNTEADGSGTNYTDEQEINNTTYVEGNEIHLYAKWTQNSVYTIEYNANGGTGSIEPQVFEYGVAQKLKKNTFTKEDYAFWHWNTKADGTGTSYKDEEEVNNVTNENGKTIILYAIYDREKYVHPGDITFEGENSYIDTGIYLFSEKNINRDFEVSFEIKSRMPTDAYLTGDYPTIMSSMDERGAPYGGMVYRIFDEAHDQLVVNASSTDSLNKKYSPTTMQKVTLKRIYGAIYLSINDGPDVELLDVSSLQPFNYPVVFGASYNGNMQPQRWFQGTLSNLKVVIMDSNTEVGSIRYNANGGIGEDLFQDVVPNTTYKLMKNTYTREDYMFTGWNTKADGSGTSYTDEQEVTNLVSIGKRLSLYAQWKKYKYIVKFDANGGTGSMDSQVFNSGITQSLKQSTFEKEGYSFAFWNTKPNGSGASYEDQESVKNLGIEENQVITLYAMYEQFSYHMEGDIVFDDTTKFDGKKYIDTHIYLFSRKNANMDFEISFEVKNYTNRNNYDTIISSLDETGNPYNGFVFRLNNTTEEYELAANSSEFGEVDNFYTLEPKKVVIKRVNGILYLKLGDNAETQIVDYATISKKFYYPLTVGASLDKNFEEWRNFYGTISNLHITLSQ